MMLQSIQLYIVELIMDALCERVFLWVNYSIYLIMDFLPMKLGVSKYFLRQIILVFYMVCYCSCIFHASIMLYPQQIPIYRKTLVFNVTTKRCLELGTFTGKQSQVQITFDVITLVMVTPIFF